MYYPDQGGPVHHGQPQVFAGHKHKYGSPAGSPVNFRYSFHNNTGNAIAVSTRAGMKFTVPSINQAGPSNFVIRVEVLIESSSKPDLQQTLGQVGQHSEEGLRAIRDAFMREVAERRGGQITLVLEYTLTAADLNARGGHLYHHESDYALSMGRAEYAPAHPYSTEGLMDNILKQEGECLDNLSFHHSIRLVDNEGCHKEKFIRIGNHVYGVKPITDPNLVSGLYIVSNRSKVGSKLDVPGSELTRYELSPESLKSFGLFDSYLMAKQYESEAKAAHEQRIAELERDAQLAKGENAAGKERLVRLEQEIREAEARRTDERNLHEDEIKRIERQRDADRADLKYWRERAEHAMSMDRMRGKDEYEERSSRRKDTSDMLKNLPAIILGLGGLIAIIKSLFTS